MINKTLKRKWHSDNREYVWKYFLGICQICNMPVIRRTPKLKRKGNTGPRTWDIHHLTYYTDGSLYDTPASKLIQRGIITLVCRPCHNHIHRNRDNSNLKTARLEYSNSPRPKLKKRKSLI